MKIIKNDIDNEQIYLFLNDVLKSDTKKFFKIYKIEFFILTLEQRAQLRKKLLEIKDVELSEYIKRNIIKWISIEKTFINNVIFLLNFLLYVILKEI